MITEFVGRILLGSTYKPTGIVFVINSMKNCLSQYAVINNISLVLFLKCCHLIDVIQIFKNGQMDSFFIVVMVFWFNSFQNSTKNLGIRYKRLT